MNQKISIGLLLLLFSLATALKPSLGGFRAMALAASGEATPKDESVSALGERTSDPAGRLESLVVEVNGERRRVEPAEGFAIVLGDLLTIVDAYPLKKSIRVERVDLIGFRSRVSRNPTDDRGRVIDTGRNLSRSRSVDGTGREYRIEVYGSEGLCGAIIMSVQDPELQSFQLEVNGVLRIVRAKEPIRLSSKDVIRVLEVRTNVRGNENVKYDVSPKKGSRELRFSRGGRIFARIPIEWQDQ